MNGTNGFGGGDQPFSLQPIEIDFPAWPASQIVKDMAAKFLNALDPAGQYTFQTVNPEGPAFILNGTLDQHFPALSYQNAQGAGIYVTVNQTDLKGRKNKNIVRIRAIPVDTDGADPLNFERLPLAPSIIVRRFGSLNGERSKSQRSIARRETARILPHEERAAQRIREPDRSLPSRDQV
jgi:hypothetical protein